MSVPSQQSPLLTPREAATWLRSTERTLERWRRQGTGPAFVRVGRHVAYRLEDLEAWVGRQTRQPGAPVTEPTPEPVG